MHFFTLLGGVLLAVTQAFAQSIPFVIDGPLESVSAKDASFNTGGSVTVAGMAITIPANLLVQFPAAFVPYKAFAADYAANAGSYAGWEVSVEGNYVNGVPIAGTFFISQLIGGAGAGVVESVNIDGTMKIANGGPTLRINTPGGVYAKAYTNRPFLTVDEENPSIASFSGFPMCIPRSANDPDCPSTNRAANGDRVYTPKDTSVMAPFIPGDYVTWAGIKNGPEILVYGIVAENVQPLTTADNGDPVYVRVEDVIIAINDATTNTEFGTTRFTGYLSDSTASISVYRLDVDPCTGEETEVQIAAGTLKAGDVRNKFDIRFRDLTTKTLGAREYRIKASKGQKTVAKGIEAGQYVAPISEVIWPEVNVPGSVWPENAFQLFGHLKDGFVFDNKQWGQLNPWPGLNAPTPAKICTGDELNNVPAPGPNGALPVADAGTNILAQQFGSITTLTGANTNAALTDAQVTFAWTGPVGITITGADKAQASFLNPWGTTAVTRTFTLKICLVSDATKCSTDTVDVVTDKTQETIKITSYQFVNKNGGTITVTAESNNVLPANPNGANLQLTFGTTTAAMVQAGPNSGVYTFSRSGVGKQPASISVKSRHNPTAVTATALLRRGLRSIRFMRN
ncbi:hypothetical protein K458DRAFT_380982 [Lentithecium fluviatile CBS 122367]|uniref:Uncharacterized protein n=1 Tax=Lentithecium fluviatile CBS 122367 TaxID=1168545 RepID=A0A6G1IC30_9PLEO|nr:hypothetical protein K458DRAFT_380982 [Lentithecium fluviatile CBS 122367]